MKKGQDQSSTGLMIIVAMACFFLVAAVVWNQQRQINALKAQLENMLSYDLPIDNIVDLEKRVEANTHNHKSGMEVVWDILARLEPRNLAKDPETNWTIVYKELADLDGRTSALDGYIWDITYELTGTPLNAKNHYAYGNEMSGLSRIDQLYAELWGKRYTQGSPWQDNCDECGYQSVKPDCPDSRLDSVYKEVWLDYAEDEPAISQIRVNDANFEWLAEGLCEQITIEQIVTSETYPPCIPRK